MRSVDAVLAHPGHVACLLENAPLGKFRVQLWHAVLLLESFLDYALPAEKRSNEHFLGKYQRQRYALGALGQQDVSRLLELGLRDGLVCSRVLHLFLFIR